MQNELFAELSLCNEYRNIPEHVMASLHKLFPQVRCELVKTPLPFQPGDILIEVNSLPEHWPFLLEAELTVDSFEHFTKYNVNCGSGGVRLEVTAVDKLDFNLKRNILKGTHKASRKFTTTMAARKELEDVPADLKIREDTIRLLSPGQMVSYFLLASYAYYLCNVSPLTDGAYDLLCKQLLPHFKTVNHQHAYLIEESMLTSGSGFDIREADYPLMVRVGLISFIENIRNGKLVNNVHRIAEVGEVMWSLEQNHQGR